MEKQLKFERYPEYKDSGENWLGKVPACWDIRSLKSILAERKESNDPIKTREILSLSMDKGVTLYSEKGSGGNKAKEDITAYKIARPNDIVINSMNVIVGSVGLSKYFGAVSPVYYTLYVRDEQTNIHYYDKIFQNPAFQMSLFGLGSGILIKKSEQSGKLNTIRLRIPMDKLNKVLFPYPPIEEQKRIAEFLDKKTAQIEQAISQKQQLIELLKERRQIVIHNAVTRGLNPDAPMKPSGIDWIGEIPAHWQIKKLKYLTTYISDKVISKHSTKTYVGMENIESWTGKYFDNNTVADGLASKFETGDILFGKLRPYLAKVTIAKFSGICSTEFLVYRPTKEIKQEYLFQLMISHDFIKIVDASTYGAKMPRANPEFIGDLLTPLPPISEQKQIVEYLDKITTKIEAAITCKQNEIEKLKEYKATLINSAVTGKIKV